VSALLEFTAELPVWALTVAGAIAFLLGAGTRRAATRPRCARCASNTAHHQRLDDRPAWLGWPGLNTGRLPLQYGHHDPDPDPERLDGDPCLAPAPTGHEVRTWVLTERLLEAAGLADDTVWWSAVALPEPVHRRSLFAQSPVDRLIGEIEALDTHEMLRVRGVA